jgi:hypothetical protein
VCALISALLKKCGSPSSFYGAQSSLFNLQFVSFKSFSFLITE